MAAHQLHHSIVRLLWLACLCLISSAHSADEIPGADECRQPIHSIRFSGNTVTRPEVMQRELGFDTGSICALDAVIDGIQSIMDLGLFRSVRAELQLENGQLDVRYVVLEKFYFLAIPRVSRTSDGELRGGLQLRWDNFTGRLHQLKITSEKRQEEDGRGRSGFVHSVEYEVPRFFGSDHGLAVELSSERRQTELSRDGQLFGESVRESTLLDVEFARWINQSTGVRGLRYFGGFRFHRRHHDIRQGEIGPFSGGTDVSLKLGFENRLLRVETYRRQGLVFGGAVHIASPATGSDFRYHRADAFIKYYHPLLGGLRNINVQARIGWSDGAPFGERTYAIGGGELLRGIEPANRSGDILTLLNGEYLSAFFAYPNWRWVVFADIGNTFLRDSVHLHQQAVRGGLGLRWKLQALTNTDLRIDVAWDAEQKKPQTYVSTRLTF